MFHLLPESYNTMPGTSLSYINSRKGPAEQELRLLTPAGEETEVHRGPVALQRLLSEEPGLRGRVCFLLNLMLLKEANLPLNKHKDSLMRKKYGKLLISKARTEGKRPISRG